MLNPVQHIRGGVLKWSVLESFHTDTGYIVAILNYLLWKAIIYKDNSG